MLYLQSQTLTLSLTEGERLRLLDALRAQNFIPLIRSARRRCFELLVAGRGDATFVESAVAEFERQCFAGCATAPDSAYTTGELFCQDDCVLFLIFSASAPDEVRAGVIYNVNTAAPLGRLERFCRAVRECLLARGRGEAGADVATADALSRWQTHTHAATEGIARFMETQPTDFAVAAKCKLGGRQLARASELMTERAVRVFLRRVQELRAEGYSPRRLFAEASRLGGVSVASMLEAGLLEREVRVSCRKSGHALFDLPTPDSLAAITLSKAKCSQCAAPVVDEVIEDTLNPTPLAVALLEDGGWLSTRVYQIIRALGVPDSEIAPGPLSAHGEAYLAANVCGNAFLLVTQDGDLTPEFSRRVAEAVTAMEATRLVVVITGVIEEEGRLRLYEFIWRRARAGQDLDATFVEGLDDAHADIARAFERSARRELSRQLCALDAALGLRAGDFVCQWFKLVRAGRSAPVGNTSPLLEADMAHTM
jgi:hypothetical protein